MVSSVDTSLNPRSVTAVPVTELYTAVQEEQLEELKVILDGIDLSHVLRYHLLHKAASHGQVKTVRLLITRYKWPVNCRNENKQTPLHVACGSGHLEVVRTLVTEYKADLKAHDKDGDTPLHVAARHGCINVIECLVDVFKCDPSTTGCEGRTILHYACYQGHTELVKMLLTKHQMNPLSNDNDGNNSLHYAVQGGWEKIVKTLTNNYHDLHMAVDCRNKYNQSPLDVACSNGHLKIAKLFVINHGLKRSHDDENLLCVAVRYGQINTVSFLIDEFKYNIRERDVMAIVQLAYHETQLEVVVTLLARLENKSIANIKGTDGCTLLHLACQQGHLGLVERLVTDYKCDTIVMIRDHSGNTPLHYAALAGKTEVATLLITKYGTPVNHQNNNNETPLHLACTKGHVAFVQTLVTEHKADVNMCDINNSTPIQRAALSGQAEVVACFITIFNFSADVKLGTNGCSLLHLACQGGHLELAEQLMMDYKLDPLIGDDNGNTPLHYAALGGKTEVATLLITKYGTPVNCLNSKNETPLCFACAGGNLEVVRMLANDHGAYLHSCDNNSDTPLHRAAICGQAAVVNCLINEFRCNPKSKGYEGRTILHHACYEGHIELMEALLTHHKLDPLSIDVNGYTPLHLAAIGRRRSIANVLITKYSHSFKRTHGCSLVHLVCKQGDLEVVEQLLFTDYKFDPMIIDDNGNTPLHYAAIGGNVEAATLLITKRDVPVDYQNDNNETPLHLACNKGHSTFIQTLVIEHKADINTCDMNNHTPLQRAVLSGQAEVVDCFIKNFNCSADVKGIDGCSLLHLACQQRHLELVEQLVTDYKLDPLIVDDNGNTPLHYAALDGKTEVATLLITKYGSPVNHLNKNNETPLHLACTKGHVTFIYTLVTEHKADIDMHDINNHIPLQRAALSGHTKVVCLLILEFNCDPNVTGVDGGNLLHYACSNGHDELAWTLISSFNFSLVSADVDGNSPLHLSAMFGQNECVCMLLYTYHAPVYLRNNSGESVLEAARGGVTRNMIETYLKEEHDKLQYDYKEVQNLSKKKYSGAQRLTRVFVLGNVQSGKSTLIESLKRQGFFSSFYQVSEATVPPHTSGIIPSEYFDKAIGRVLYYDFAGDPEYYSSHSAIMSSVMQSKGTNICLILVNYRKDDKCILEELGYWFGFISYHCTKLKENCKVLTIGSHIDLISKDEAKKKAALVSEFIKNYLSQASKVEIEVVKSKNDLTINCCNPRSSSCVHNTLNQLVRGAATFRLSEEAAILLGLLEKDFKNVVTCKVQTLLTHIMQTGVHLPNTANSLYPTVLELHTIGLLLIIEGMSGKLEEHLLLLNVPKLTNEVHKLLFSKESAIKLLSSTDPHTSATMGILPQTYLNSILPDYITTECLIQLQYCQEFSHAEVKFDYSIVMMDSSAFTLLYFPALCEMDRKENIKTPEDYNYSISWYLKCDEMFNYLPPRFLHVLLLRLAHSFALPTSYDPSSIKDDATATIQLYNRRCTMWKNGIHWLMEEGVECFVENVNNSKGIVIITKSEEAHKSTCTEMLFNIIKEIHQAKEEFCGTITLQEYLIDSNDPTAFTKEDKLFSACDIARVLQEGKPYIVSVSGQGHTQLKATKIFHMIKYVHWGKYVW